MKQIVSVSLGPRDKNDAFETEFLGQSFRILRFSTHGDMEKAAELLSKWDKDADAMGLGHVRFPYQTGPEHVVPKKYETLNHLLEHLRTPVVTGEALSNVGHGWALRHIQFEFGGNYFDNAKVLFLSGMNDYAMAKVMSEYTENLTFADLVLENGISRVLNSFKGLERYAKRMGILRHVPARGFASSNLPLRTWNDYILRKAMQKADIIVIPFCRFYEYAETCTHEELGGKIVISSSVDDDQVRFLKTRRVKMVIDTIPRMLEKVVGPDILEALIVAALEKPPEEITTDDLLEIISEQKTGPQVIYPLGKARPVTRFAFVIHPLSQEHVKNDTSAEFLSRIVPASFLNTMKKMIGYASPWTYSNITGIKSPTGAEAEGWLITVGGTPEQMLSHEPEFTYGRLLHAVKMAKQRGAQIVGLGSFAKDVGDAGATVAALADVPVTTGNSYGTSAALWATADAVRRLGLSEKEKGKRLNAKAMVMGGTSPLGLVCCRLLGHAFEDIFMVDRNMAKLLALRTSVLEKMPDISLRVSTRSDKYLREMDVIVIAASEAGTPPLDIMNVRPGCVITNMACSPGLSAQDVAKRPDVLVIESGEIRLPGNPEMKDIGLPPGVVYAPLAETIALALEGRFENFVMGREIRWQKVRGIYEMGLRHGMTLAGFSGTNGAFSNEDIARVRELALEARAGK